MFVVQFKIVKNSLIEMFCTFFESTCNVDVQNDIHNVFAPYTTLWYWVFCIEHFVYMYGNKIMNPMAISYIPVRGVIYKLEPIWLLFFKYPCIKITDFYTTAIVVYAKSGFCAKYKFR